MSGRSLSAFEGRSLSAVEGRSLSEAEGALDIAQTPRFSLEDCTSASLGYRGGPRALPKGVTK